MKNVIDLITKIKVVCGFWLAWYGYFPKPFDLKILYNSGQAAAASMIKYAWIPGPLYKHSYQKYQK